MVNPSKYIRKAYLSALGSVGIGSVTIPIFDKRVPINVSVPPTRIIISTQTTRIADENKCDHGWECSIVLDVISEQPISFVNSSIVDDIEGQIMTNIDLWSASKAELMIPPFICYHTTYSDSHDIEIDTPTTTIIRRIIRITHRLNNIIEFNHGFTYIFPFELA